MSIECEWERRFACKLLIFVYLLLIFFHYISCWVHFLLLHRKIGMYEPIEGKEMLASI